MSPKLVLMAVITLFPAFAMAQPKSSRMSDYDQASLQHRHDVNLMEIEMGKMAQQRGTAPVKKYAAALVKDHEKADKEVMSIAKTRGVTLTEHAMPANDAERASHDEMMKTMDRLATLEGAAFDKEYLKAMVDGHTAELGRVTSEMARVTDTKLKAHLGKTKTTVERHAEQARALMAPAPNGENTPGGTASPGTPSAPPKAPERAQSPRLQAPPRP
jgi:predicted outer membrane protein